MSGTLSAQYPVASFFSGAMGLDIGLSQAGLATVVCQEFDARAVETIRANGHIVVPGDLRALLRDDPELLGFRQSSGVGSDELFLVAGGPPCQPFSNAGLRKGLLDDRGTLVFDYVRAIGKLRPRFALLENVKGLVGFAGEHGSSLLDEVLAAFREIGYRTVWGVVDAVDYGAPQFRERLVIVGSRDNEPVFIPKPTHFQCHQDPAFRWRTFSDAVRGLVESDQFAMRFSPAVQAVLNQVPEGGNWRSLPADIAEEAMGGAWRSGGGKSGFFRRLRFDEPSPTVVTSPVQKATMLAHPTQPRPLSVQEYARLQGFPDSWVFSGPIASQYRQIGNAVPVPLGRAFGQMLVSVATGSHVVTSRRRPVKSNS